MQGAYTTRQLLKATRIFLGLACCLLLNTTANGQITFVDGPPDEAVNCPYVPPAPAVQATSTCPGNVSVSLSESRVDGTCVFEFQLIRTWTATDACGNQDEFTQTISVSDTQSPILAGIPSNQTVTPGNEPPEPTISAIDFCDPNSTLTVRRDTVDGPCGGRTVTWNFIAADACGNERTATYVLTITDDVYPEINGVTPGRRLTCGEALPTVPNVTVSDNGNAPRLTLSIDTLFNTGGDTCMIVRRVWTATDDCLNTTTAEQRFSFHDGNAPIITGVPSDTILYCEALPLPPALYTEIQVSDNCDANPGLQFSETSAQTNNGTCSDVTYLVTRTWTAVDECGNETSVSQTLHVKCECCFNGIDDDDDGLVDDYDPQCNCFSGAEAECDSTKMYFVPPVWHPSSSNYNQPSELVITTLADVANVHIMTGDGTTFNQTFTVVKGTPTIIPLTTEQLQTPNHNQIENDRGWVITSDQLIQPIYRIDGYYNKVLVTIKGPQALGRVFRAGSQTNTCGRNDMRNGEGHFISVMATEDNTDITLDFSFPALNGLTGPITRRLNKFETYLIRDDRNNTTVSGSLITSTKPVVVMSGSQHTKACAFGQADRDVVARGMDGGIDQLVPNCLTGDEYVLVRGKGNEVQQYAVLVANKNNTRIVVDGQPNSEFVLNAGEYHQVWMNGGPYQPKHFKANKPFYMFHVSGISTNNEVGMAIAAPVGDCKGDTLIQFPIFASPTARGDVQTAVYSILPRSGLASLTINGNSFSSCATATDVPARPDLAVVTFEDACLSPNNVIRSEAFMTAGMLVGINRETGTHGYLTAFKDRMSVFLPGTDQITTGYLIDTLCGNQTVSHCVDVASCAVNHSIAAIRQNQGTVALTGGTCFEYTSPTNFNGEDELFVTLQNDQGLFQTVCLRYYICAEPPEVDFPFIDTTVTCEGIPPVVTPTMSDECDMDIQFTTEEVVDNGSCDYAYILYRNWAIWDDCGDSTIATQTIRVVDTSAPQAINIPSDTIVASCTGIPAVPTITFQENCDNNYDWDFNQTTIDSNCVYDRTIVRTWEAWDGCGNRSTAVQRIELRDTVGPTLFGVPTDEIVSCTGAWSLPLVTATDDCDPNPTIQIDSTVYSSICDTIYHVVRQWTATDACGQATTATQRFLVIDLQSPVVLDMPADTTIACGQPLPTDVPNFVDDCTNPVPVFTQDSVVTGTCPVISTVYRRWTATDDCGNVTQAEQIISIVDSVGPSFIPLPDTIFSSCLDSVVVIAPDVIEACNLQLTFTDSMAAGVNCNADRFLYRTYHAVDNCGREAEYTQLYYFQDIVPPFWVQEPRDTVLSCNEAIPPVINPTVADACSGLNPVDVVVRDSQRICPARQWIIRTYTVSDWCGNLTTFTHTITIDGCEPAIPALATAQAGCTGEEITLTAGVDSGYTTPVYLWQYSFDGTSWVNIANPITATTFIIPDAQASNDGFYRVVVANNATDLTVADCSSTSEPVEIQVLPPDASSSTIDLCRGDTLFYLGDTLTQSLTRIDSLLNFRGCDSVVTLALNVYPFVQWDLDTTLCFGESLDVFGRTYTQAGVYRDTLITPYGCDTTLSLTLSILPALRDTNHAVLCPGGIYSFNGIDHNAAGTYDFPLQSSAGCDSSETLILVLEDTFNLQLDTIICPGEVVRIGSEEFNASGTYTRTLSTIHGCDSTIALTLHVVDTTAQVTEVSLCEGSIYFFGNQRITAAGTYREQFTNQYGCDSNVVANVVMSPIHDVEIREELCAGEVYTNNGYSFTTAGRWRMQFYTANGCDSVVHVTLVYRPNLEVNIDTLLCEGSSFTLLDTIIQDPGTYTRVGQTQFGCDSTVTARLTYKALGLYNIDTTLCFGESLTVGSLTYTSTTRDTVRVLDQAGCDSTIYVDLTVLDDLSQDTTAVICEGDAFMTGGRAYSQTGMYRYVTTASTGCDSSYTVILTVIPTIHDTMPQSICIGDTLTIGGALLYQQGNYTIPLSAMTGCDSIVYVQLEVRDTVSTEVDLSLCEGVVYRFGNRTLASAGTYVEVFDSYQGCDSTVTLNLTYVSPTYEARDTMLCYGTSFELSSQLVTDQGVYLDSMTSILGCDSIVQWTVDFRPEAIQRDTVLLCEGEGIEIGTTWVTESGTYTENLSSVNNCDSTHITEVLFFSNYQTHDTVSICFGNTILFGDTVIQDAGSYQHSFSSVHGCDSTVTLEVYVVEEILIDVDDIRMCSGSEGQLHVRGYTGPVEWSPAEGLSCTNCLDPIVRTTSSTEYTVTAIDCHGEEIQASAYVTIDRPVDVSIVSARKIRLGERTTLVAVADNPSANLAWREGNELLCEGCDEVEVQPLITTTYQVEATTIDGCNDQEQLTLIVEDECSFGEILVPNIMTPNGDGVNDELEIRYEGIQEIVLLRIYGRWGELIYETRDIDIYWDGTHHGEPVNPGVFVYYLSGYCLNGEEFTEQGNVTVVR